MADKITVIATVFNESDTIESLVGSLRRQTLPPGEVVIVDGGSSDDTYSRLLRLAKSWPVLKPYRLSGNRSVGRNYAIAKSTGSLIAITDAGCLPHPDWLKHLTLPFSNRQVQIVSGYYEGRAESVFQKCLIPYVLVMPDKAYKMEFYPSTRSMAIRRKAFIISGGFNENLSHNEDFAYANHLKNLGFGFTFAPEAIVSWIPRKNLSQAAWMFTRFAIGDIQSGILRPKVKLLILRELTFIYLFFLSLQFSPLFILWLAVLFSYLVWSIAKNYRYVRDPQAFFWLPVLQLTSDFCVSFGSLVGFLSRSYS